MADPSSMLASAVVLPEVETEPTTTNGPTKRRRSSVSSTDSKRPRLDTSVPPEFHNNDPTATPDAPDHPAPSSPHSARPLASADVRRRQSIGKTVTDEEQKKRGKRLFGGIMGALSQKSNARTQKQKEELEKKQITKLRQLEERQEKEQKLRAEELQTRRAEEQKAWDERSTQLRHANSRAMAHFLQTETEPRLYYEPYELLPAQKERIAHQIAEVDKQYSHSSDDTNDKPLEQLPGPIPAADERNGAHGEEVRTDTVGTNEYTQTDATPAKADADIQPIEPETTETLALAIEHETTMKDVAEDADDVVEAGEDTVIY